MRAVSRCLASLALVLTTGSLAAQTTAPVHVAPPPSMNVLRSGNLSFWVSSRRHFDGDELVAELKKTYPALRVQYRLFAPADFASALEAARKNGTQPDAVFADNYGQAGPLIHSGSVKLMSGRPRFPESGWWMALKDAPDLATSEAFLIWLEEPPGAELGATATSLSPPNQAAIRAVAEKTMKSFESSPVWLPHELLDPAIAAVTWDFVSARGEPASAHLSYTPTVVQMSGNDRLAFAIVSTLEQGENSFGILHSFMVLRKTDAAWRLLLLIPNDSLPGAEQQFAKLASIRLSDTAPARPAIVTLLAPADGAQLPRFPNTAEISFQQTGEPAALTGIEYQYFSPGSSSGWSPTTIVWVDNAVDWAGRSSMPVPFGVGNQPHRWRVWSVDRAGVVTLSDWRIINFTN